MLPLRPSLRSLAAFCLLSVPVGGASVAQEGAGRPPSATGGAAAQWLPGPPESLPGVTVRWEDPGQAEVFVVEGADYQCRIATHPARVVSLRAGGEDVLGPEGMAIGFEDAKGVRYTSAPRDVTPDWMTWQGQSYKPARSSRARMNVWSASPYYWDAHLSDIPLLSEEAIAALASIPDAPPLINWSFDGGAEGWRALNNCTVEHLDAGSLGVTVTGGDPYIESPPLDVRGPVVVSLRMRCTTGGGAAFYWYTDAEAGYSAANVTTFTANADGEWHRYRVPIKATGELRRLRFDPPGESGNVELDWVRLDPGGQADGKIGPPARGELVFHAHPDQLRVEFAVEPVEGSEPPQRAFLISHGLQAEATMHDGRPIVAVESGDAVGAFLGPKGAGFDGRTGTFVSPLQGAQARTCWAFRPLEARQRTIEAFDGDLNPLPATALTVEEGYASGYDPLSGLYVLHAAANAAAFGFEPAYKNPSRRFALGLQVANDARPRRITIKCLTGIGNLEAAVLTDAYGFPVPVPAFVCKNFAGEREEPDDSAFGDSYFPLYLSPGEERDLQLVHLLQDWGNHPLKQVSSIRFFHVYWHLSTGASETTCFTHDWMQSGGRIFHIPDFRPMSGEMWPGQPQHGVGQWPGLLQYNDAGGRLVYEGTTFESVSPCLTRFTMRFHTSDNAATARVGVLEAPQRDELRTFLRLRYDWQQPVAIEGDARLNFRWLNMNERQGADLVVWTDADGATQTAPVVEGTAVLLGEPLCRESGFVGAHGKGVGEDYHSLVLVRRFRARLGGRELDQAAASAIVSRSGGDYWLTVPERELQLQPGDFVEAEVMLMPHGEPVPPATKPERERERFGANGPRVEDVSIGEELADFPATVRAAGEVAEFTLRGGFGFMPVVVAGFRDWRVPLLWRDGVWQDQQVHGGDGYQVEPDGFGGYRFVFVYPTRTGQEHRLMVTRARCSEGISRVFDLNGSVVLEAPRQGEFALKAPVLFGPGRNEVAAGSGVVEFKGVASRVRQLPLGVSITEGRGTVEILRWDEAGTELRTEGAPMTLTLSGLHPNAAYAVNVNGTERRVAARGGTLRVEAPAGESRVTVRQT